MLDNRALYFTGAGWPTAQVTGARPVTGNVIAPAGMVPRALPLVFDIAAIGGKPRAWAAHAPEKAIWRSWVDAVADDTGGQVESFVRRFGDPLGQLTAKRAIDTARWLPLLADLTTLADAWSGADASTGISEVERADDAIAWLRVRGLQHAASLVIAVEPSGVPRLVLKADTLGTFMLASAVSALARKASMRRCRQCAIWFELPRIDTYFCSTVCRNAHYRAHGPQQNLNAAMAMAAERAAAREAGNEKIKKQRRGAAQPPVPRAERRAGPRRVIP